MSGHKILIFLLGRIIKIEIPTLNAIGEQRHTSFEDCDNHLFDVSGDDGGTGRHYDENDGEDDVDDDVNDERDDEPFRHPPRKYREEII